MSDKVKYPREEAMEVARWLCKPIKPLCAAITDHLAHVKLSSTTLLKVCGSLRRGKDQVGDVEMVFVSREREVEESQPGLFGEFKTVKQLPVVLDLLDVMVKRGLLTKRLKENGQSTWGQWNRLAVHTHSGIPVDFFRTTFENWWMTVVIRTGPKDFNLRLIESANKRGFDVHAYGTFTRKSDGTVVPVNSEREVFDLAGLPWLPPEERR
jgi:DNA polymerase/3'-5' exonuclease PolX